jgi:hypothetical protein
MGRTLRTMAGVLALTLTGVGAGCSSTALMMLTEKDGGKHRPEYPFPAKGDAKTVTVAIVPSADATNLGVEFAGVDRELAALLNKKMAEATKDSKIVAPIKVVELPKVEKYLNAHPDWQVNSPGLLGKPLGADYVMDMRVNRISMYDPGVFGQEAFAGNATVTVAVYDAADPDRPVHEYVHQSPQAAKPTSNSAQQYRQWFVNRLATELARKHTPHQSEVRDLGPIK